MDVMKSNRLVAVGHACDGRCRAKRTLPAFQKTYSPRIAPIQRIKNNRQFIRFYQCHRCDQWLNGFFPARLTISS
jgi:hypothetical protein